MVIHSSTSIRTCTYPILSRRFTIALRIAEEEVLYDSQTSSSSSSLTSPQHHSLPTRPRPRPRPTTPPPPLHTLPRPPLPLPCELLLALFPFSFYVGFGFGAVELALSSVEGLGVWVERGGGGRRVEGRDGGGEDGGEPAFRVGVRREGEEERAVRIEGYGC